MASKRTSHAVYETKYHVVWAPKDRRGLLRGALRERVEGLWREVAQDAHLAIPTSMAYNMAKAAVDQMARTAALELAPRRIRVNLIHPGWTDTPGERKFFSEEVLQRAGADLPWGRLARPEEIARGIVFLLEPDSDYITGATLSIDGGIQLPWWSKRGSGEF